MQSVPGLLLLFLGAVISEFSTVVLMCIVGLLILPETANGIRERVDALRQRDFVEAARELGQPDHVILWNEIIWHNARRFVLARATQGFIFAILADVTLSYMKLTDANNASGLGQLLAEGREAILQGASPAVSLAALVALLFVIGAFVTIQRAVDAAWAR